MMVDPEREVPGTIESTWNRPMPSAVFQSRSSMRWTRASLSASTARLVSGRTAPEKWRPRLASAISAATSAALRSRMLSMTMNAMP